MAEGHGFSRAEVDPPPPPHPERGPAALSRSLDEGPSPATLPTTAFIVTNLLPVSENTDFQGIASGRSLIKTMSLLDPKLSKSNLVERLSLRSTFWWSVGVFGFLTIAGPILAFGTFTAKDERGLITGCLDLLFLLWLLSGAVIVGTALAAAMRWWKRGD
jgi:hypothetical protein